MANEIEIMVDGKSLVGGLIGGLLFIAPNVTPFLFSGLQTAFIASNAFYFQLAGTAILLVITLFSVRVDANGIRVPRETLYSGLTAFLLIIMVGYVAVFAAAFTDSGSTPQLSGEDLRLVTLDVDGMVCQGCRLTVKNYLESIEGTKKVTVSLSKRQATVVYDSTKLSAQELASSNVFQGAYTATVKTDKRYEDTT